MSAGAVFKLIANDGKADRLIMATSLLNQRIKDVMCARKRAGMADITPTLNDLERTHILFVNAHFKPFAAIGFEYNKVKPQSGNPALNNSVTFSIPQFGDFFHDMVGHQTLSKFSSSVLVAPTAGVSGYPDSSVDWDDSTALPAGATASYSLVDAFGNAIADGDNYRNLVRYCEYPGERLYQNVKFDVNGNPLDEYNDTTINMLRKFTIGADKITGYKRLVGQEVCMEGYSGPKVCAVSDSDNDGAVPFTTFNVAGATGDGVATTPSIPQHSVNPVSKNAALLGSSFPDAAWNPPSGDGANVTVDHTTLAAASFGYQNVMRQCLRAADGPQTPKLEQPALEIWNKLRFWFCDDARLSIPSVSIPFGQRFITVDLAAQSLLAFEFPGLYVKQTIVNGTLAAGTQTTIQYRPWASTGTISEISLSNVELYVNNIFVNPEIHDIFIKRIGFSLIRVYRFQRSRSSSSEHDEKLLSQLKWPVEYMFIGLRPSWNINSKNSQQWRDWHHMSKVVDLVCDDFDLAQMEVSDDATGLVTSKSRIGQIVPDTYTRTIPTVTTLSVTTHGIAISDKFPQKFHSSYNPFHYGGPAIVTPDDEGALMVNFSLFPRSYQPAGHLNISRARETFLSWTTSYVTATQTADLLVVAIAINFLLITDGSAVLRYST